MSSFLLIFLPPFPFLFVPLSLIFLLEHSTPPQPPSPTAVRGLWNLPAFSFLPSLTSFLQFQIFGIRWMNYDICLLHQNRRAENKNRREEGCKKIHSYFDWETMGFLSAKDGIQDPAKFCTLFLNVQYFIFLLTPSLYLPSIPVLSLFYLYMDWLLPISAFLRTSHQVPSSCLGCQTLSFKLLQASSLWLCRLFLWAPEPSLWEVVVKRQGKLLVSLQTFPVYVCGDAEGLGIILYVALKWALFLGLSDEMLLLLVIFGSLPFWIGAYSAQCSPQLWAGKKQAASLSQASSLPCWEHLSP